MLFQSGLRPSLRLVYGIKPVCDRIGTHRHHRTPYILVGIRLTHHIKGTRDLLIDKFFRKILHPGHLGLGICLARNGVQAQFPMYAELQNGFLDCQGSPLQGSFIPHIRPGKTVVLLQSVRQAGISGADTAFHERRGKIGMQAGVCPAFCHHRLSHIGNGVHIKMRKVAHKSVAPVLTAQGHLLARSEFKAPVRPEMNESIRLESVLGPQIRCNIGMRRCGIGAMDYLEIIVAHPGRKLRKQHHIAEPEPCKGKIAFRSGHIASGKFPVHGHSLGIHVISERF